MRKQYVERPGGIIFLLQVQGCTLNLIFEELLHKWRRLLKLVAVWQRRASKCKVTISICSLPAASCGEALAMHFHGEEWSFVLPALTRP